MTCDDDWRILTIRTPDLGVTREAQASCVWEAIQVVLLVTTYVEGVILRQYWYGLFLLVAHVSH